jgi:hypothetical protein
MRFKGAAPEIINSRLAMLGEPQQCALTAAPLALSRASITACLSFHYAFVCRLVDGMSSDIQRLSVLQASLQPWAQSWPLGRPFSSSLRQPPRPSWPPLPCSPLPPW